MLILPKKPKKSRDPVRNFVLLVVLMAAMALALEHFFELRESLEFSIAWICDSRWGLVKEASPHDTTSFE